jgi:YidC/Oxa1 family membrane protein insertase
LLASFTDPFSDLVHPLFWAFAWLLAEFYSLIPNYAVAIALLTIAVMIVAFPITRRGTRSMTRLQLLAPELASLQSRYRAKADMTTAERREQRQQLNKETSALYKEQGISPAAGCLPTLLQLPIFWILYGTIRGLTHEMVIRAKLTLQPLYVSHVSRLYASIVAPHHGLLPAFGIDLADTVRTAGLSWPGRIPYLVVVVGAVALQYLQTKLLNARNSAVARANPRSSSR